MESTAYKEWIQGIFDRTAPDYGQTYNTYFNQSGKKMVELAAPLAGSKVLDIATGRGAVLKEVSQKVGPQGHVIGIDISPQMIHETSKALQSLSNIKLRCMDAEQLDFADKSFDLIFCGFGLFFFPNVLTALQEMRRVLKPQGKLWLSSWGEKNLNVDTFNEALISLGIKVKISAHDFVKNENLKQILASANFHNIQIRADEIEYVYPSFDYWFDSNWAHGNRGKLEKCTPAQLSELKSILKMQLEHHFQQDGWHEVWRVNYTSASVKNYN